MLERLQVAAHEAVMIGDSLDRDIAGATTQAFGPSGSIAGTETLTDEHPILISS